MSHLPQSHDHEEHDDDKPVGRVLSRREMLSVLGGGSAALFIGTNLSRFGLLQQTTPTPTATALPSCVVRPELTEGPYFVDLGLNRSDIRIDPLDESMVEGTPFKLIFNVSSIEDGACVPLEGAQVDVWHCDAYGVYSGVESEGTAENGWLRGYQVTDEFGVAEFITIYPGWYQGRAVHIHFKIRTDPESDSGYEFTSQFFFDPELTETVYLDEPYAEKGSPDMSNEDDGIYQQSDGALTLDVVPNEEDEDEEGNLLGGYKAVFTIGLDLTDDSVGADDGMSSGGGRSGGNPPGRP